MRDGRGKGGRDCERRGRGEERRVSERVKYQEELSRNFLVHLSRKV